MEFGMTLFIQWEPLWHSRTPNKILPGPRDMRFFTTFIFLCTSLPIHLISLLCFIFTFWPHGNVLEKCYSHFSPISFKLSHIEQDLLVLFTSFLINTLSSMSLAYTRPTLHHFLTLHTSFLSSTFLFAGCIFLLLHPHTLIFFFIVICYYLAPTTVITFFLFTYKISIPTIISCLDTLYDKPAYVTTFFCELQHNLLKNFLSIFLSTNVLFIVFRHIYSRIFSFDILPKPLSFKLPTPTLVLISSVRMLVHPKLITILVKYKAVFLLNCDSSVSHKYFKFTCQNLS